MKKTILSLFIVFAAFTTQAQNIIASYNFADGFGADLVNVTAEVSDEGVLYLTETRSKKIPGIGFDDQFLPEFRTLQKTLHPSNFRNLKWKLDGLSNAEVMVSESQFVCKLFPSPAMGTNHLKVLRGYDYTTKLYQGEMELVHGPQGCWLHRKVRLKEDGQNLEARSIKQLIRFLSLELLNE